MHPGFVCAHNGDTQYNRTVALYPRAAAASKDAGEFTRFKVNVPRLAVRAGHGVFAT